MRSDDTLQRFIFDNRSVRGEIVRLQESLTTILNQHPYPAALRKLLSEALCVAALLSAIIKFEGRLTVQFRGKGHLKLLLAQCTHQFHLRGLAKWEGELSYAELMDAFHQGVLVIMIETAHHQHRYQGIVAWQGNSLIESIEGYFKDSEQIATKLWITTTDLSVTGLLLQVIPSEKENKQVDEWTHQDWETIYQMTNGITGDQLIGRDNQNLLEELYPNETIQLFSSVPIQFQCTCSRKRSEDAIFILGREEAEAELAAKQRLIVTCDFCNKEYIFDKIDVAQIFESRSSTDSNLH